MVDGEMMDIFESNWIRRKGMSGEGVRTKCVCY